MIKLKTKFPIALDSDDHIHPEGIYLDNNLNPEFLNSVLSFFRGHMNYLDLGCAGGELVCEMHRRGNTAVGLEGSDHCLNVREDMVKEMGTLPYGYKNWEEYHNEILFTCDVTKDYTLLEDGIQMEFDLITCWDVMEHFTPDAVDNFLKNVSTHLKPNGIFVASIALFGSGRSVVTEETLGINYHKSVFPRKWWIEKIEKHLKKVTYPFSATNRTSSGLSPLDDSPNYLLYTGKKK